MGKKIYKTDKTEYLEKLLVFKGVKDFQIWKKKLYLKPDPL